MIIRRELERKFKVDATLRQVCVILPCLFHVFIEIRVVLMGGSRKYVKEVSKKIAQRSEITKLFVNVGKSEVMSV